MEIIGASIVLSALIISLFQKSYHLKPRVSFATAVVFGKTEDSETVQFSTNLMTDETSGQWDEKLTKLYELREKRLKFQNQRMVDLQEEVLRNARKAKEEIEAGGGQVSGVTSLDREKSKRV